MRFVAPLRPPRLLACLLSLSASWTVGCGLEHRHADRRGGLIAEGEGEQTDGGTGGGSIGPGGGEDVGSDDGGDEQVGPDGGSGELLRCSGVYLLHAWRFDDVAFDPRFLNDLIESGLADGEILATVVLQDEALWWRDNIVDAQGALRPDPGVPDTPPLAMTYFGNRSFRSEGLGELFVYLPQADYPDAQPLVWHLHQVHFAGSFVDGCRLLHGRLDGAFRREPQFSMFSELDADTDGDGVPDGYHVRSGFEAEQLQR